MMSPRSLSRYEGHIEKTHSQSTNVRLDAQELESLTPKASFESEPSHASVFYSNSNMSEDMHQILSPSFDSGDGFTSNHHNLGKSGSSEISGKGSSYSADSIIRRVEEEIAAARIAAINTKSRINDFRMSNASSSKKPLVLAQTSSNSNDSPLRFDGSRVSRDPSPASVRRSKRDKSPHGNFPPGKQQKSMSQSASSEPTNVQESSKQVPSQKLRASSKQPRFIQSFKPRRASSVSKSNTESSSPQITMESNSFSSNSESFGPPLDGSNSCGGISIDDDMHDILGVNDDDEEKKSSTEPMSTGFSVTSSSSSNRQSIQHQNDVLDHRHKHLLHSNLVSSIKDRKENPSKSSRYTEFDKIDFLRKQVGSDDSHDRYKADEGVFCNKAAQDQNVSDANPSNLSSTETRTRVVTLDSQIGNNKDGETNNVFSTEEDYSVFHYRSFSHDVTPRNSSGSNDATTESTKDEWQIVNDKSTTRHYGADEGNLEVTVPAMLIKSSDSSGFDAVDSDSYRLRRGFTNNGKQSRLVNSDDPTPKARGSNSGSAVGNNSRPHSSPVSPDEYPIIGKSSTEDAIVSVQHHPVFQKRISAADLSVSGSEANRSPPLSTKKLALKVEAGSVESKHTKIENKEDRNSQMALLANKRSVDPFLLSSPNVTMQSKDAPSINRHIHSVLLNETTTTKSSQYHMNAYQKKNLEATTEEKTGSALNQEDVFESDSKHRSKLVDIEDKTKDDEIEKHSNLDKSEKATHDISQTLFTVINEDNYAAEQMPNADIAKADFVCLEASQIAETSAKAANSMNETDEVDDVENLDSNQNQSDGNYVPPFQDDMEKVQNETPEASEITDTETTKPNASSILYSEKKIVVMHVTEDLETTGCENDMKRIANNSEGSIPASALENEVVDKARPSHPSDQMFVARDFTKLPSHPFDCTTLMGPSVGGCKSLNTSDPLMSSPTGSVRIEDRISPPIRLLASEGANTEWDKASELLYRLKEQRESFSANFFRSNEGSSPMSPSPKSQEKGINLLIPEKSDEASAKQSSETQLSDPRTVLEDNGGSLLSGTAVDIQQSPVLNQGVRSPKYFNFMKVKRAKQRAKKTLMPTHASGIDSDISSTNGEESGRIQTSQKLEESSQFTHNENDDLINNKLRSSSVDASNLSVVEPGREEELILTTTGERTSDRENYFPQHISSSKQSKDANQNISNSLLLDPPTNCSDGLTGSSREIHLVTVSSTDRANKSNHNSGDHSNENQELRSASPRSESIPLKNGELNKSHAVEELIKHSSRRIRFRNPFPIIKPPPAPRDMNAIIRDHTTGVPEIPVRWVKPKKELRQLIVAAMGTSLARRSNACGALKVLTRHKKNQMTLVRTDGFLAAVTFAATQKISEEERDLAIDARTRAVAALRNVCTPKDNRELVLKHPGVVESLSHVAQVDTGEGRTLATGAIALLAKTPSCRENLARVEGLIDILSRVMSEDVAPIPEMQVHDDSQHMSNVVEDAAAPAERDSHSISAQQEPSSTSPALPIDQRNQSKIVNESINLVDSIRNQVEERREEFKLEARANACAALLHLSKQCSVSHQLSMNVALLDSLICVANEIRTPLHSKCLEILCNLTRLPANNYLLSRYEGVIDTLVIASNSVLRESRLAALRSLQNISADPSSKSILATGHVLTRMISCAMRKDQAEKEVAVATIYNITTEPSAVAAITNTKNVVATLVHLAHSPDSPSEVRLLACEALSTISLWLQTLAGTGKVPQGVTNIPLPSQKTTGWQRWD